MIISNIIYETKFIICGFPHQNMRFPVNEITFFSLILVDTTNYFLNQITL